jgi:hypothetical protein
LGTKKEAGGNGVIRGATCGPEPQAFVGFSSSQNCCSTKGEMGEVSCTTKVGSLIW